MRVFILGEMREGVRGEGFATPPAKSAPAYYQMSVPQQVVVGTETAVVSGQWLVVSEQQKETTPSPYPPPSRGRGDGREAAESRRTGEQAKVDKTTATKEEETTTAGREVTFELRGYAPDILLVRGTVEVEDLFQHATFDLEAQMLGAARKILERRGGNAAFSEEYTAFVVAGYEGPPEQFLKHSSIMASLLKSERLELDPREVEYTLQSQIKYEMNDLTIIDWDGAFLFDPEGDVEEDLNLLILANLQLLRHRILDRQLDERLARMAELVGGPGAGRLMFRSKELAQDLMDIVQARMQSITELQRLEREIKLIGDWYSARYYDLATAKFKISDWRRGIQSKLESIEDIYTVVVENFSVSAKHRAEWIQIILFFVLQIGWFVLIVLEFIYFTRGR
jgi:hypothetical protein